MNMGQPPKQQPAKPLRILIVDDHFFVRMGLSDALSDEPDIEFIAQAASGEEAIEQFRACRPDVVILDLLLPDMEGSEVLRRLSDEPHPSRFIILSVNESEEDIFRCVEAGAAAYLPKSIERQELLHAIRQVAGGREYFPQGVAEKLDQRRQRSHLTAREMETLTLLVRGLSNKQIAATLRISQATVKLHVGHIFEKLGVSDRTQAVTAAIARGIVRLE